MDTHAIAARSDSPVAQLTLRKALDVQQAMAAQLLQTLPAPVARTDTMSISNEAKALLAGESCCGG